jgi:hypothetical protein
MARNEKFAAATSRARGETTTALATGSEPGSLSAIGAGDADAFRRTADAASLKARIESGELEAGAQLLTLQQGDEFTVFVAREGTTKIDDLNKPGTMKETNNWYLVLLHPDTMARGPMVTILGAAQLDRQLRPLMGQVATVARGGDIRTPKKRVMTEYFVGKVKTPAAAGAARDLRDEMGITL